MGGGAGDARVWHAGHRPFSFSSSVEFVPQLLCRQHRVRGAVDPTSRAECWRRGTCIFLQIHLCLASPHKLWKTCAGSIEYEELSSDQRGAVLSALESGVLDTAFMRLTIADIGDKRREANQELNTLRTRLRKWVHITAFGLHGRCSPHLVRIAAGGCSQSAPASSTQSFKKI